MSQPTLPSILVVEDNLGLGQSIVSSLQAAGLAAAQARDAADAVSRLRARAYDGLVVGLRLPDADGLTVLGEALDRHPDIQAVVTTGFGGVADAVAAIERGAADFLIKPFQLSQLPRVLHARLEQRRLREENAELKAQIKGACRFENIIGRHRTMQALVTTLGVVAPMNSTVLIHGETGTGKELVARTIHGNSPRADGRFVAFRTGRIPDAAAESGLLGRTTASSGEGGVSRASCFEAAHGGTLFIDDVASLSLPLQARLLTALQGTEIARRAASRPALPNVRLIAATSADLGKQIKEGSFREDLFYHLNVIPLTLPALRQRREDIPLLAQHFVRKSCSDNHVQPRMLNQAALRVLMTHDWPGNVRQLENAIEYAVAMAAASTEIGPEALPDDIRDRAGSMLVPPVAIPDEGLNFTSLVSQLERELILRCLEKTGGNKRQAARLLNLSRTTFIDKLHRLNLERGAA